MREHRAEIDAIGNAGDEPTFANTVAAFDRSGRLLDRIAGMFYNLTSSETSPALQAVERELAPQMSAHNSAVHMHRGLFARIDALHAKRAELGLSDEQRRVLERFHTDFVRSGAKLGAAEQARYAEVMQRLAELTTRFGQNVLADESAFRLLLQSDDELAGLPPFVRAAAKQAAADRGLSDGCLITLSRSHIVPFLTFSERRDLREQGLARMDLPRRARGRERQPRRRRRDPRLASRAGAPARIRELCRPTRCPTPWPATRPR